MTKRGRRVLVVLVLVTGLLFAGRWTVEFLAGIWWAAAASPAAEVFAVRWALLRAGMEVAAILASTAWFVATLLLAARLATRALQAGDGGPPTSALRPELLRWWALGIAALLGVLCGGGSGTWAPDLALAAEAPRFGLADAQFGWDVGFFLASLPVLAILQEFLLALALLGFVATTMLYAVAGTLRVTARQFALDPAIRLHLGVLGALLALVLGAGYLMQPLELAAGLRPSLSSAHLVLLISLARVMAGFSLAVALLTLLWGLRGRMMLPIGGWASYALFAIAIRLLAPAAGTVGEAGRPEQASRELEQEAFAIPALIDQRAEAPAVPPLDSLSPQLWTEALLASPHGPWLAADRIGGSPPAAESSLLLVGPGAGGAGVLVFAVPDAQVTAAGGPMSVRPGGEAQPGMGPLLEMPDAMAFPGHLGSRLAPTGPGVEVGGFLRRLALSWALQENLFRAAAGSRVSWRLDPGARLLAIAPFAEWSAPRPRLVAGQLYWVSDGYLYSRSFPGVAPTSWRGRSVSYLRAAFVGVVAADDGTVHLYERGRPDPLTSAWSTIARGLVEPADAMPPGIASQLDYPAELFGLQERVLQRAHWSIGQAEFSRLDSLAGPVRRAAFMPPGGQRIVAILEGAHRAGGDVLRVLRLDSLTTLDGANQIGMRWERLPFVNQMQDSIRAGGARLMLGMVRLAPTASGLLAYQTGHAVDSTGRASLALVNLALGGRLGTGPRTDEAWRNLRGEVAALPVSVGPAGQLREARFWLLRADSAFRKGDLAAFGRAFEALRAILDYPPGPAK